MSFLFGAGRSQPTSAEKIAMAETEIEMVSDMFNRYISHPSSCKSSTRITLSNHTHFVPLFFFLHSLFRYISLSNSHKTSRLVQSCTQKCIPSEYREGELNKGESVCLDRCVSKFFEVNFKVSEKMQGEAAQRAGAGAGTGAGAGGFGM